MERHTRKKKNLWGIFLVIFVLLGVLSVFVVVRTGLTPAGNRKTVVLVGDPVTIISYDSASSVFILLTMPANTVIEGVHGYGTYAITSLWKLGHIEGKAGAVMSQSLEELLGIPIQWYIGGRDYTVMVPRDPLALAKSIFSVPRIFSFLRGAYTSNMSIPEYLAFSWNFLHHPSNIETFSLSSTLIAHELPDGSMEFTPDPNLVDQKIGNAFEDSQIRKEGISVAIFNTTPVTSLGTRVSRFLSRAGMLVVMVGNDRPTVGRCTIRGLKKALASKTAAFIAITYGCAKEETGEARADLTVRVGTQYQSRFLPFTK